MRLGCSAWLLRRGAVPVQAFPPQTTRNSESRSGTLAQPLSFQRPSSPTLSPLSPSPPLSGSTQYSKPSTESFRANNSIHIHTHISARQREYHELSARSPHAHIPPGSLAILLPQTHPRARAVSADVGLLRADQLGLRWRVQLL